MDNYLRLNATPYAIKKLGSVLDAIEDRWLRELHYALTSTKQEDTSSPPLQLHLTSGVMGLTIASGLSTILYKPDEYIRGKAGKHFKGLLNNYYPWHLDPPKGITSQDAVDALYDEIRNPLTHSLGIDKSRTKKIVYLLPAIYSAGDLNKRIIDTTLPFGSSSIKADANKITFAPASFYWGIRKMIECMLTNSADVDDLLLRLQKAKII